MNSSCVSPILESYNGKDLKKALAKKVARHEHFPFGQSPTGFVLPMKFTGPSKKMKFTGTSLGLGQVWGSVCYGNQQPCVNYGNSNHDLWMTIRWIGVEVEQFCM